MEWKKTWQVGGGTAEFSVSIDPNRLWKKEEEKFEDWEVIDTPPYEEMKNFHGTTPPSRKDIQEHEDLSGEPVSATPSLAERRGQETPSTRESKAIQTPSDEELELRPCDRCNGYHYIDACAYHLSEEKWRQYQHTYMAGHSNQPRRSLQRRVPVVKKTQTRMSDSAKKMLAEDTEYRKNRMLENGRPLPTDPTALKQQKAKARKNEGSEDELDVILDACSTYITR